MDSRAERHCIVCNQAKTDGIVIVDHFICANCEQEIVQTDVKDAKYSFYIHQLKRLWMQLQA